jgi:hypothetical protein
MRTTIAIALAVLLGLLLFKALDPHPRCNSTLLARIYDADQSCLQKEYRGSEKFSDPENPQSPDSGGAHQRG